jgi:hypothetical protein
MNRRLLVGATHLHSQHSYACAIQNSCWEWIPIIIDKYRSDKITYSTKAWTVSVWAEQCWTYKYCTFCTCYSASCPNVQKLHAQSLRNGDLQRIFSSLSLASQKPSFRSYYSIDRPLLDNGVDDFDGKTSKCLIVNWITTEGIGKGFQVIYNLPKNILYHRKKGKMSSLHDVTKLADSSRESDTWFPARVEYLHTVLLDAFVNILWRRHFEYLSWSLVAGKDID